MTGNLRWSVIGSPYMRAPLKSGITDLESPVAEAETAWYDCHPGDGCISAIGASSVVQWPAALRKRKTFDSRKILVHFQTDTRIAFQTER